MADYEAYFARHESGHTALVAMPRVLLAPGLGLFGLGETAKAARIAADIAENTIRVITDAEAVGSFASISEAEMFAVEYWSLEQAKLGKATPGAFAGQVAVITGAAQGIGAATARAFAAEGAEVALLDLDGAGTAATAEPLGGLGIACDVTDGDAVAAAMQRVCEHFGGLDIVVSNAGAAWQGRMG